MYAIHSLAWPRMDGDLGLTAMTDKIQIWH